MDFVLYIDNIDNKNNNISKKTFKPIIPKKKCNTRVLCKSKTLVINNNKKGIDVSCLNNKNNDNRPHMKEPKTLLLKHNYSSSHNPFLDRQHPMAKFVSTDVFIQKMRLKKQSKFSFARKYTKEFEKILLNIKSAINIKPSPVLLLNNNTNSSKSNIKGILQKMNKHFSLPYFGTIHRKKKKKIVLDTLLLNISKGIKHSNCFRNDSNTFKRNNCAQENIPLTTQTKKSNQKINTHTNIHSIITNNTNRSTKYKVFFDSFVITNYPKNKGFNKIVDKKSKLSNYINGNLITLY